MQWRWPSLCTASAAALFLFLLNFFAEDLPQSLSWPCRIEIEFKRAVVVVYQGKGICLNIEANNADAVLAFAPSAAVCLLQTDTKSEP